MNKLLILFLSLVIGSFSLNAENTQVSTYEQDTAHISRLVKTCGSLLFVNPDSAFLYSDSILDISKKIEYNFGLFKAYNIKGIYYWVMNDLDQAIEMYRHALIYSDTINDPRSRALLYGNMGLVFSTAYNTDSTIHYYNKTIEYSKRHSIDDMYTKTLYDLGCFHLNKDNYVEAIKSLIEAKYMVEKDTNSILLIYLHNTFGVLYTKVDQFDLSLHNYLRAIELNKNVSKVNIVANTYINIGELYFRSKKDHDSAIYYYNKAITASLPYEKTIIKMKANINKGNVFLDRKDFDSAYFHISNVLKDPLLEQYPKHQAAIYVNMGVYLLLQEDFVGARKYLNKGYKLSDSLGLLEYTRNAAESLSDLDSLVGDYKNALHNYKVFHIISDSLKAVEIINKIEILNFEKFISQQEYENGLLLTENVHKSEMISKQRILIWISFLSLIVLLIFVYSIYRNRIKIKLLLSQLSTKHDELQFINEELTVTNDTLNKQTKKLYELNITKDKFFSILGHDLKSPFNTLLGFLDLLTQDWSVLSDDKKQSIMQSLYSSSKKTYVLLEQLLEWGKAQQGLLKPKNNLFKIKTEVNTVIELLDSQIKEKSLILTIDISEKLEINNDARLFKQIIQNLLNNAIKYTHDGGSISITAEDKDDNFVLCVHDTGIGIPEIEIPKIFDLDCSFNRPGTKNEKSTGMGLILSKEYAELINAKLSVTSEENKGSVFCLSISK